MREQERMIGERKGGGVRQRDRGESEREWEERVGEGGGCGRV